LRPIDQSLIENDADTDVTALKWNPPTPPTVADDMIRGGIARGVNGSRALRISPGQLAAVPIFDAFPSRPRRRRRVLGIGFPPSMFPCQDRSHARCIDNQTRTNCPPRPPPLA